MKFAPRLAAGLASGLATALLATGCGADNPKPAPLPSGSPSASPTAPAAGGVPEAAKANTEAGAKAFVRYYVSTLNAALGGDFGAMKQASLAKTCASCRSTWEKVGQIYADGGSISGGRFHLTRLDTRLRGESGVGDFVIAYMRQGTERAVLKSGDKARITKGSAVVMQFFLAFRNGRWVVRDYGVPR